MATGAGRHEQLAAWSRGVAAGRGVAGRSERVRAFGFARCAARRAATWRIVEATTGVKLLLATGKHEGRVAIAAGEGLVCVLHADSRGKEVVEVLANRTSYVGARLGCIPVAPKYGSQSSVSSHAPVYGPSSSPVCKLFCWREFLAKPWWTEPATQALCSTRRSRRRKRAL
jgi:hypothetical protein